MSESRIVVFRSDASGWLAAHPRLDFVRAVDDPAQALAALEQALPEAVVAEISQSGVELLRRCREQLPHARRLLLGSYAELPLAVRLGGGAVCSRVLRASLSSEELAREALGWVEPRTAALPPPALADASQLLARTAHRLLALDDTALRGLSRAGPPELQLVVATPTLEPLERLLGEDWGEPLLSRGSVSSKAARRHPAARALGPLAPAQWAYARQTDQGPCSHAYLAVLPWAQADRATLVLGLLPHARSSQAARLSVEAIHREVSEKAVRYFLPAPPEGLERLERGRCWYCREYDWVVTADYAGPDRRQRPTSFLNRYVFRGRRHRLPENSAAFGARFVDRVPAGAVRWVVVYLLLSALDTLLTTRFVGPGHLAELNPLLRSLLARDLVSFLLVKNLLSISAVLLVLRFQLWKAGRIALALNAAGYALLDAYWLILLLSH